MSKVDIVLSEGEYRALVRLLYFADYCAFAGGLPQYSPRGDSVSRDLVTEAVEKFYAAGAQLGMPTSWNLTSMADNLPFAENELLEAKELLEKDLDYMAQQNVAQAIAKQEVDRTGLDFDYDGGGMHEHDLILKRMVRYRKEFKANGFANLRFKFLHQLPSSDE